MEWPVRLFATHVMLASAASASVFDVDDQVAERGTPPELGAIGAVTGGSGVGHATGFLISDCEVLTVKHAAGRVSSALGRRLRFARAAKDGRSSKGTVVAEGNLDLIVDWFGRDRRGDWLLLRLDRCLGRESGHVRLSPIPFYRSGFWSPGSPALQSAGFPGRRWRGGITRDPHCRIRASRESLHFNDCAAQPGNSGSPLFVVSDRGAGAELTVFAMQSLTVVSGGVEAWRLDHARAGTHKQDSQRDRNVIQPFD